MIVSYKHNFIFVKTEKTGSTSIEVALSQFADGPKDIVSVIHPAEEGHTPRNWEANDCFSHMPAEGIKQLVGKQFWDSAYKFCVERNPWDKMVSLYYWRMMLHGNPNFNNWIKVCRFPLDFSVYFVGNGGPGGGKIGVDFVGQYARLQQDFDFACQQIGLPQTTLPKAKSHTRPNKTPYQKLYTPESIEIVRIRFRKEINMFGYKFEGDA